MIAHSPEPRRTFLPLWGKLLVAAFGIASLLGFLGWLEDEGNGRTSTAKQLSHICEQGALASMQWLRQQGTLSRTLVLGAAIVLTLGALASLVAGTRLLLRGRDSADTQDQVPALEAALAEAKNTNRSLHDQLAALGASNADLLRQVGMLAEQRKTEEERCTTLTTVRAGLEEQVSHITSERDQIRTEGNAAQSTIAELTRQASITADQLQQTKAVNTELNRRIASLESLSIACTETARLMEEVFGHLGHAIDSARRRQEIQWYDFERAMQIEKDESVRTVWVFASELDLDQQWRKSVVLPNLSKGKEYRYMITDGAQLALERIRKEVLAEYSTQSIVKDRNLLRAKQVPGLFLDSFQLVVHETDNGWNMYLVFQELRKNPKGLYIVHLMKPRVDTLDCLKKVWSVLKDCTCNVEPEDRLGTVGAA
ncbi:MAG: hypothetical protein HZA51_18275 [Planctomycetes bacterium]|nr:hypothetical protein [Planctomycetota bacterium]